VVLEGGLALILAITSTFETLLVYVGFTLSLGAAACVLAALLLRRREPQAPRPYRTPGWPLVPLAYLALTLWITVESIAQRPRESAAGALTLAVGLLLYAVWRRPRAQLTR
jgi:APA family basic amino acid/polyamine antiporter